MSRCHKPGLNPPQASFVSGNGAGDFFSADFFSGFVRTSVAILLARLRPRVRVQQRTRFAAKPASLVSLYLVLMSFPVSARVSIVVSRSTRCREAISFVAIETAVHAFTAPKAHRSMHGTCT